MLSDLPRLKPNPIPAIHPVPEYAAAGRLKEVYETTKSGLNVPWMGVVTMAFAHYPRFYDCLWQAIEPFVASDAFEAACQSLRQAAEAEAHAFSLPDITKRLTDLGYGIEELEEIRACNEIFSAGNMPYLLIATLARLLLEGYEWSGSEDGKSCDARPEAPATPILIEPHHANPTTQALYADIRETLGLPFVNTDYRAFARWPSYFELAWKDIKPAIQSDDYEPAASRIHRKAISLALSLPNTSQVSATQLQNAAKTDADLQEIHSVVQLFQWLLPGLALNVALLREQVI